MTTLAIIAIAAAFVAGVILGDRLRVYIEAKKAEGLAKLKDEVTKL